MFFESDRLHLFTREEIEERLNGRCSYDWFVEHYRLNKTCGGKLIEGNAIVEAMLHPPVAVPDPEPTQPAQVHQVTRQPRRGRKKASSGLMRDAEY